MELAAEYMKKAGFESGKCEGDCELTMVGDDILARQGDRPTLFTGQLEDLGFEVELPAVGAAIMYTRFCSVPSQEPQICPNVGWIKDFNDAQSILQPTFSGESINPSNNSNWPHARRAGDQQGNRQARS